MLRHVLDRDSSNVKDRPERFSREDRFDLVAQDIDGQAPGIEVHVVGISRTSEEKPQITASLQSPFLFIQLQAEMAKKDQMKELNGLPQI